MESGGGGLEETLKIAAKKHDVVAIKIYDERETELPAIGMLRVRDAETGEIRWIDTLSAEVRRQYSPGGKLTAG
jgi:hypothetical protein